MRNNKQKKVIYEILSGVFETSSKDLYLGSMHNGLPDGKGMLFTYEGARYAGRWRKGRFHGHGTFICYDGTKYIREWKNGKVINKDLRMRSEDKKYICCLKNRLIKDEFRFKQMHLIRDYQEEHFDSNNNNNYYNRCHESLFLDKEVCSKVEVLSKGRVYLANVRTNDLGVERMVSGPDGVFTSFNEDMICNEFH